MFPSEPVPERIGTYKVLRRLPGVGSADVYVGRMEGPMGFSRLCTLKLVRNTIEGDAHFAEELVREAAICAVLNHPSIQRMFDFFEHDRHLVLVLEHVEGVSLDRLQEHLARRNGKLEDGTVAFLGRALAGALAHAHAAKDEEGTLMPVIHRTMHPENVLIDWDGHVRLTGFGLGKILGRSPDTVAFVIKGAPGFMAPEQSRGERVTPKADVYGLGILLWSLFSGNKPPEVGTRPARLSALRQDLPKELTNAIDAALEPTADKRKVSCQDLERILGKVPGIEDGQKELEEKISPLKTSRTKVSEAEGGAGARRRVPLDSVRPAKPAASSKQRLSVPPPSRPPGRLSDRPGELADAPPTSVYPLLRALAERVPGPPRLPMTDGEEEMLPEAPFAKRAPAPVIRAQGPSKPSIATPLGSVVPEGEWKESVPDEELFDQLFEDATSRSGISLAAMGFGAEEKVQVERDLKGPAKVVPPLPQVVPPLPQVVPRGAAVIPPPPKVVPRGAAVVPPVAAVVPPVAAVVPPVAAVVPPPPKVVPPDAAVVPEKTKRMEFADTVTAMPTLPQPTPAPASALPAFAPPPMPPPAAGKTPVMAAPVVPPRFGAPVPAAAVPSGSMPAPASASVSAAAATKKTRRKRPPPIALVIAGGVTGLLAAAVVTWSGGADPNTKTNGAASASASVPPELATPASATPEPAPPQPSAAPSTPPVGYGMLTVGFPSEGNVYVGGKRFGRTNEASQVPCGSRFIRVSSTAEGPYPEWLSAGETIQVPCQQWLRIELVPGRGPTQPPRKKRR